MADFFFGSTDTGKIRTNNEDTFIVQPLLNNQCIVACVIDGVGGYEGGEVAAAIAKETILTQLEATSGDWLQAMKQALIVANENIYAEKVNNHKNSSMACVATLAVADLSKNQVYYAHVGDTRLYLLRDHSLVKVTHDHSFVGFLEDNKRISEAEAMRHPKRNEINKALGFDPNIGAVKDYVETGDSPFLPGDLLLLCSDGLSDLVDNKTMTAILTSSLSIPEKTKELIDAANKAGGKDNITVVLVQNPNKPVVHKATKPKSVKKNEAPEEKKEPIISAPEMVPTVKKHNSMVVPVLAVLCVVLAGMVIWLWQKKNQETVSNQPPVVPSATIPTANRNAIEQKLADSINSASMLVLNDSAYGKNIIISDTIFIKKDSLHINGNGMLLQADSIYKGPAFVMDTTCKNIVLEDIVLQNFDIGIMAANKALHLKHVRFINCRISVLYAFLFPQNVGVSGSIPNTAFFKPDSLLKANQP